MSANEKQRKAVRGIFTRLLKDFNSVHEAQPIDPEEMESAFRKVETQMGKLTSLDDEVARELAEKNTSEAGWITELEKVTEYQNQFTDAEIKFKRVMKNSDSESGSASAKTNNTTNGNGDQKTKYRLPKLEWSKFSGDPREWLAFWSQFKVIHDDPVMKEEEKFQYLIQATVEKSEAWSVVRSFPPSKENYAKAVEYLKARFGNDEFLVEIYVRDLLRHVLHNAENKGKTSISALYDKLETQLRALETLGVTRDKNAAMLYPLVESSLPEDTLKMWQRVQSQFTVGTQQVDKLTKLMEFLKVEVGGEIRVKVAHEGFSTPGSFQSTTAKTAKASKSKNDDTPTAIDLFNGGAGKQCIFCEKPHASSECFQARKMSIEEKEGKIREKKACYRCLLPGHSSKYCKKKTACYICGKGHLTILCRNFDPKLDNGGSKKKCAKEDSTTSQLALPVQGPVSGDLTMANQTSGGSFLQTLIVRIRGPKGVGQARALIDSGSERSYLSHKAVDMLGLQPIGKCELTHNLFGGSSIRQQSHRLFKIEVGGLDGTFPAILEVLDQPKICGYVRRVSRGPWINELAQKQIKISDVGDVDRDIQLLIGADYAATLTTGNMCMTSSGLVGVETTLGWTLMGKCPSTCHRGDSSLLVTSLHVADADVQDLWKLDLIGIRDDTDSQSRKDLEESALQHFLETVSVNEEGRYEVGIPWITGHPPVPVNRELAEKRLLTTTKKLQEARLFDDYNKIFEDWLNVGIIEEVEDSGINCSYLPHRAVLKPESSTTPLRPVFDASACVKNSPSLNQCMEKGPNLIEKIPRLLTQFRMGKFGVISDIRKAFLQISVQKQDRDVLRFLWWDKEGKKLRVFRHARVVFGLSSSPFLLGATINHHLENMKMKESCGTGTGDGLSMDESCGLGLGAANVCNILRNSFYLDNCIASFDDEEEVDDFVKNATRIMAAGKFDLRGWVWNTKGENTTAEIAPVLGLVWNTGTDELSLDLRSFINSENGPVTRRKMLSMAHRIFDPLGFACPVTLIPRKLVQDNFRSKAAWDLPVHDDVKLIFEKWCAQVLQLKELRVPRNLLSGPPGGVSLHVFADASSIAYAACVYLRKEFPEGVKVNLVMARNRLSTEKKITIPRLELLGCFIASRLGEEVKDYLNLGDIPTTYWTDSSNALYWIKKNENWAQFVWNRVAEIRRRTRIEDWHHIPGEKNPADLPSRGCNGNTLIKTRWEEGPEWLYLPQSEWPKSKIEVDMEIVDSEKRKTVSSCAASAKRSCTLTLENENTSASFPDIVRRYARDASKRETAEVLSIDEWEEAETALFLTIQADMFQEGEKILQQLCAFQDGKGLWRVKSRIVAREDIFEFLNPLLLKADHPVVKSLVRHQHENLHHCGIGTLLTILRERFWIVHGRRLARKVVHSCVRCRRFEAKRLCPVEAPLPLNRVRDAVVFEITGMDLGGPLYLKGGEKAYFVVFTCAVYRAVHLELVLSLSSEALVGALERFIARRTLPSVLYSDNGTNFVGVYNEFSRKGVKIEWIFSVVNAPWWGGFWERVVGLVKKLLVRLLQKETVNAEDMSTILAKCEEAINARPLTHLSDDPNDLTPLTPATFLRDQKLEGNPKVPEWTQLNFGEEFKRRQKLLTHFKKRFRDEYLSRLVHNVKKKNQSRTLKVGDLVMVELDNRKRIQWPLARVLELYPGRDGVVRVARLKTENGEITRALQRIFPLEVDTEKDVGGNQQGTDAGKEKVNFTRSGRASRMPMKFQP